MEWQPIETAPYTTNVLAWINLPKNPRASGVSVAQRVFLEIDDPDSYGVHQGTVGCWWANGRYYHAGKDTGYVTHWMPLPEAPKQLG